MNKRLNHTSFRVSPITGGYNKLPVLRIPDSVTFSFKLNNLLIVLIFSILLFSPGFQTKVWGQNQTFTTSGTFTVPSGVTQVTVECWGAGGGGGRARGNPSTAGGGAGGSFVTSILTVTPEQTYTVSVGSGGAGGNATGTTTQHGRTGGDSWFGSITTIIAKGGAGGQSDGNVNNSNGLPGIGSTDGCIGDIIFRGGHGSQGVHTSNTGYSGAGGGGAGSTGMGGNANNGTGGSGTSQFGGNGANGVGNNTAGSDGSTYGGGGSGGKANNNTDRNGGNGANGLVVVTWTPPPTLTVVPANLNFGYTISGGISSEQTYTLSGTNLSGAPGNISVTAPSNFELSLTSGSGFGSSVSVPYASSTLASRTIYVRFKPTTPNTDYIGNITNSGGGSATQNVAVTGTSILTYCASNGNMSWQTSITLVNFNTINNISAKPSGYSDYTSISTNVIAGSSYPLTINLNTDGNYLVYARVWIDWNQDGDFNGAGEEFDLGSAVNTANGPTNLSPFSITIPSGALTGNTRMRVSAKYNSYSTSCETNMDGEVEDYTLNIAPAIATSTITGSPFCAGASVSVPYTISGTFTSGNVFTAQLSNSVGSFASPVNIGTLSSVTAGTISGIIPEGTTTGTGYRIRVVSSTPEITGTSNGSNLTVNSSSPVSVIIAASANPICAGSSVTFTATPTNGGTSPTYQWKLNGANVGTNSPIYTNAALTNGNTVSCVMTSNAPCASGSSATSNTITMTVNPVLPASVSIAASANPICAGTSVTFTATPTNGGTSPTYQWKLNGANVGTNSPTYTNAALVNGNTVFCVMTSNAPCSSGSPATSNTITMTVNTVLPASVSIAASANPICAGTSVTFTATPTNGGTSPAYQWKLNGSNVGTNSPTYTNAALANGNTISCVMTSNAPCASGSPATSNAITMEVAALIGNNSLDIGYGIHGTTCGTAVENANATVSAPVGAYIAHIIFASYGTPNGSCGTFTYGACNATTSFQVTENYLLGNNSASIPATNGVFGDPCVGTLKRLYIQAIYAEPICAGSSPGEITGTLPTGGNGEFTYLWESSTTSATTGFSAADGVNDQQSYTPQNLSQTTWFRRTAFSAGCSNTSRVIQITVSGINTWTGTYNTDWNNSTNWSCFIPDLTTDITFSSGLINYPVLNSGPSGQIRNIIIEPGASVTVSGNTLQIAGTITSSGTFTASNGSIEMRGSLTQSIAANSFTNNSLKDLTINNSQGVSLEGPLYLTGILTAQTGNFATNNHLTLISSPSQTALIDGSGNGEITGNVTMQRYLPSGFGYKYVSSPFQDAMVGGFAAEIDLTADFPTFYRYDENRDASGWVSYVNPTGLLQPMAGYTANAGTGTNPKTLNLSGTVNNGVMAPQTYYNRDKTYTKGFNLVGNPYPSPIDWDASNGWTRNNIDNAIYYFDAGTTDQYTGTYSTYINGISSNGNATNIIASMQGFFVHVSDGTYPVSGSFGMDNRVRVNDLSPAFHKSTDDLYRPVIRVSAGFEEGATNSDPLVIYFDETATSGFENELDAIKLNNSDPEVPNFYALSEEGRRLSIGAWPTPGENGEIPLGIKTEKEGMLTFSLTSAQNLKPGLNIFLKDKTSGMVQDFQRNPDYKVYLTEGDVQKRFALVFSEKDMSQEAFGNGSVDAYVHEGLIYVIVRLKDEQVNVSLHNIAGQSLVNRTLNGEGHHKLGQAPAPGVYVVTVFTGMGTVSKKILVK